MTKIVRRYFCDGCHKEKKFDELMRVMVGVWRRADIDPQTRLLCEDCRERRQENAHLLRV